MIAQTNATDASQAVHLENDQRAKVLFHNSPHFSRTQQKWHGNALTGLHLTDRVKALEDQTLAHISCCKTLLAAIGIATYHASSVQIQTPDSAP